MKKIIFSLTAHESIDCLYDLIDNIKACFVHYNIIILLSITNRLHILFDYNKYSFVKVVTVRNDNLPVRSNINLFQQHIININYIQCNKLDYDYFWFVASNEMFIKIVPEDFVDNNVLSIISKKDENSNYAEYYKYLLNTHFSWGGINQSKRDTHLMKYLYNNKFIIHGMQHEGVVLPAHLALEIFNEYSENKIFELSTSKSQIIEEIFIPTYLNNKYNIKKLNPFCFIYKYTLRKTDSYEKIMLNIKDYHLSIKPVNRIYNDPMRTLIRNKIVNLSNCK